MKKLDIIDHIAIQVNNIQDSLNWYIKNFKCNILYSDDTWAFIEFSNTKLALVTHIEHPPHVAILDNYLKINNKVIRHRDGSYSRYLQDLDGNYIELIKYS